MTKMTNFSRKHVSAMHDRPTNVISIEIKKLPLVKLNFPLLPGATGTFSAPMVKAPITPESNFYSGILS